MYNVYLYHVHCTMYTCTMYTCTIYTCIMYACIMHTCTMYSCTMYSCTLLFMYAYNSLVQWFKESKISTGGIMGSDNGLVNKRNNKQSELDIDNRPDNNDKALTPSIKCNHVSVSDLTLTEVSKYGTLDDNGHEDRRCHSSLSSIGSNASCLTCRKTKL